MKSRGLTFSVAALLLASACGGPIEEELLEEPGQLGLHAAALETPEEVARGEAQEQAQSVWAHGCRYTLAMVRGWPPIFQSLTLTREASPHCVGETLKLVEQSFFLVPESFVLAEKHNELVVAWRQIISPNYGIAALFIHHVSPETLQSVRQESLVPYFRSGSITDASLEFHGHRLIVHGAKTGIFYGEPEGSHPHFTATYPNFLTSTEAPAIVVQ
jgi:hypothetical protein